MNAFKAAVHCTLFAALAQAALPAGAIEVPPPPAPTTPDTVNIGWMVFVPATLTVKAGTTVTWFNADDSNHRIKLPEKMGPRLDKGMSYQYTFSNPGTYHYECGIHGPRMSGTIVVQ